jgi:hypothetical protein
MYVRFTIPSDPERTPTGSAAGIFRAAGRLRDAARFHAWEHEWLREDFDWFNQHLPVPTDVRLGRAVCWFKPQASEMISRVWRMAALIERTGVAVRVYRNPRPGTIVYEDDFQVAALPWRSTFGR